MSDLLYLSREDVIDTGVSMIEIIGALEAMFLEKGEGRVEMPPKPGIHPRADSFIHAMPAYIPAVEAAGMKWIAGYPGNQRRKLPYIHGLLILNDPETGVPIALMDATWITAERTGAATAVAARLLARPDSSTVGILACGVQGRSNLVALTQVLPVRRVFAYDIDDRVARDYRETMGRLLDVDITVVSSPREAVTGMDVVVTSGPILKNPTPVIEAGWLSEGAFACPLDFDSYWTGAAMREFDHVVTDDRHQLDHYRREGYFRETPEATADLGEIVAGHAPRRTHPRERILCINLGLALEDMATAVLVYRRALEKGLGQKLSL